MGKSMRTKKIRTRQNRNCKKGPNRTRKNRRRCNKIYVGGHANADLPHYHLFVQFPRGKTRTMQELFERSNLNRRINAATIGDIQRYVEEDMRSHDSYEPFTLFWKGKKLEDANVKLRQIVVEQTKLPLYDPNFIDPIVVRYNKDIGDPVYFEAHDLDLEDFRRPQTPR